jgi:hypothetical protein
MKTVQPAQLSVTIPSKAKSLHAEECHRLMVAGTDSRMLEAQMVRRTHTHRHYGGWRPVKRV